jgi:ubiquinone biosynthesis protein
MLELPYQVHDTLEQFRDGQIEVGFRHQGLEDLIGKMDKIFNRMAVAVILLGGFIGSALIGIFSRGGPEIWGLNILSFAGFGLCLILSVWLIWGIIRSGRL